MIASIVIVQFQTAELVTQIIVVFVRAVLVWEQTTLLFRVFVRNLQYISQLLIIVKLKSQITLVNALFVQRTLY